MSGMRDIMRSGWHPKDKGGDRETWRGQFKGVDQVAGWMGKGKKDSALDLHTNHTSRPLTALKDPASFGPPPKNVNYHGGAALPNETTPHTSGLGAPLKPQDVEEANNVAQREAISEQQTKPAPPPVPYRADRTGLKTDNLPPPPVHRDIQMIDNTSSTPQAASKAKPSLPPRLPSRQSTGVTSIASPTTSQPPTYETATQNQPQQDSYLNQNAVNRLSRAGISVPGFEIGSSNIADESNPWKDSRGQTKSSPSTSSHPDTSQSQLSELQTRFARMSSSAAASPTTVPSAEGTTWEQKQAALRTAQNFHKDPSSVTISDAQSAAATANNFRERHSEQISAGASKANEWNKKYNITGKVSSGASRFSSYLEKQASPVNEQPPLSPNGGAETTPTSPGTGSDISASINRKPPPPPPPKKPTGMHMPPPVPLGTKPTF